MGFLSLLLVWTFVCPLWRERHSLGMLSVLFMVVNCSWTSRELISDFLAVFCFPCFETGSAVPEELWNQRQQVYFKRMWQTIQEFLCPQSEVWYNHCREFWPWTSQAFTGSAMYWPSLRGQGGRQWVIFTLLELSCQKIFPLQILSLGYQIFINTYYAKSRTRTVGSLKMKQTSRN